MNSKSNYGFLGLILRQRFINRWQTMHSIKSESVLEHTAEVATLALIASMIAKQVFKRELNTEKLLSYALIHDSVEVLTGDVISIAKHANNSLSDEFKKLEQASEARLIRTLPADLQESFSDLYNIEDCYEKSLAKACDVYSAFIKCKTEVSLGNKAEYADALERTEKKLEAYFLLHEELKLLHDWFGSGVGSSVDKLLCDN